ncbi:basic leucine zipper transcriptional factor ATF-like 3 [Ylistrum balloti]|uniref:basic leucine zipper transcriptional factor ATF-like 3 n=1 Tax=Ylistrum balloti TaxID=509963 RepID=UPI002905C46A|nr:basic leucine zipper transcriptional factor ATF-like 3 [Ylistrum balloti]
MAVNLTDPSDEEECKLAEAALACYQSGQLTPLIKEELKYKIQAKRMEQGKGELHVQFTAPNSFELTKEEALKSERRRQQNRVAARKFRKRQLKFAVNLDEMLQTLEAENSRLHAEVGRLSMEKNFWQEKLNKFLLSTIDGHLES